MPEVLHQVVVAVDNNKHCGVSDDCDGTKKITTGNQRQAEPASRQTSPLPVSTGGTRMTNRLTLGVTTIGDLLLRRKVSETDSGKPLDGISLCIPVYQRPYKWTTKNAYQLLDDIQDAMSANRETYRVGTLILHHDEEDGTYNIVDGQQRTITFALLLRAFGEEDDAIPFLGQGLSNNALNRRNVVKNYEALRRRASQIDEDRDRKDLLAYIEGNCEMIVVITENLSEAFQFFDSQNARGKALYPHDLLKAFHLREMADATEAETERIVKTWEDLDQEKLARLLSEYLYRLKVWVKGERPAKLDEGNIDLFKGVTSRDSYPYAQYYKGAFAYADAVNSSHVPFVAGVQSLSRFQIDAPIIAGRPFFEYAKHYFDVLADVQNNDRYEGYYFNDNEIVKTLDLKKYRNGVGNRITRLMFDTAVLLYVDRFCPAILPKADSEYLDQFVVLAFVWAYSMRAQYRNVGWLVAQNYVSGEPNKDVANAFNIYKVIAESDSPSALMGRLSEMIDPLSEDMVAADTEHMHDRDDEDGIYQNYLHFFRAKNFWKGQR